MTEVAPFIVRPNNMTEALEFARMVSNSSFCPKDMRGKPGDVLIACQMGSEIGLSPMQAMQNIAVINGRPCIWGDAALAVVQGFHAYEYHKEWHEGFIVDGSRKAICLVKRAGQDEYRKEFSIDDAKKAGLWGKVGPWSQYPDRMLQMRARAFAIRDKFADALRGINVREEVIDIPKDQYVQVKVNENPVNAVESVAITEIKSNEDIMKEISPHREELEEAIRTAPTLDQLKIEFERAKKLHCNRRELYEDIICLKDIRKEELTRVNTVVIETGEIVNDKPLQSDG